MLFVSPSQLQAFAQCERRWYYESVAQEPRAADAGGQYLALGQLVDHLADEYVGAGRTAWHGGPEELVAAVRAKHANVGGALTEEKWVELAQRALRLFRSLQPLLPAPGPGVTTQHRYRVSVGPGVVLTGRADLRAHGGGLLCDVKTTIDRKAGVGRDADTPAYAKTPETLGDDWQARCYAWAEFRNDPLRAAVEVRWLYVSKTSANSVWPVSRVFQRAETLAWFEANVRPALERMLELAASAGLAPEEAKANHDSCGRCFMRHVCRPFDGAQQHDRETEKGKRRLPMATLAELRARQNGSSPNRPRPAEPASADLTAQLAASVKMVAADGSDVEAPLGAAHPSRPEYREVSREAVYAALVAEAAEAAGGTQDDRRADRPEPHPLVVVAESVEAHGETAQPMSSEPLAVPSHADDAKPYLVPAEPAPEVRRGRGARPRKPRAVPLSDLTPERAPETVRALELEALATAVQQFADAANILVSALNAELRRLGVQL